MLPLRPNDRVLLRDRPWLVRQVREVGSNHWLLELEALDGDEPRRLSVATPPEELQPLPTEEVTFDLTQLDSLATWTRSHRILGATLVRETGVISGARFGRVALEAYQLAPTLRILSKPRPSLLIADDVGLGKTIEAGLVMLELMARGRANRVLVVTPAGLMEQWKEELAEKFGMEFTIIGNASDLAQVQTELPAGVSPWDALSRVITSMDYIKKETVRNRALRKRWDLIIVDEAHALAESGTPENPYRTQRTRLGEKLRDASRGLLLLTATPHNGYPHSFRSLIELVEPTLASFHGSQADIRRRVETAMIRRMKSQIRRRLPDGREERVFPRRTVRGLPVSLTDPRDRELLTMVSAYCSRTARLAQGTEDAELISFAMQIIKKRALSSRAALMKTIEHRLDALRKEEAREEKPTKAELKDYQADLPVPEAQNERIARRILRSAIPQDERRRKAETKALNKIRRLLRSLGNRDPKIEVLVSELKRVFSEDSSEKVIVFTEYRDTLDSVRERLENDPSFTGRVVTLHGGLSRRQRLKRQEIFSRPEVRVLLATDAASEGLNLQQYCRRVIHIELPWNPNRLEQRNGRVDRYGQTREPIIRYLYYPDSPEEEVLNRLVQKIEQMAEDRVSTPDVLGVLTGRGEIEQGLVDLDPEDASIESQKHGLVRLFEDRTAEFVRGVQPFITTESGQEDLRRVLDLLDTPEPLIPDDLELEQIVMAILGPTSMTPDPRREGVYRITVPWAYQGEGVAAHYPAATFRRSVAIRYRADEVEYITPMHPLIKAIAADARRRLLQVYPNTRGLPPRRLAARTVGAREAPSIVFTYIGTIRGGGGLLEEWLLPVRVTTSGEILGTPEENFRWLKEETAGSVPREVLERLFGDKFEQLRSRAEEEAQMWLRQRVEELRIRRQKQAELLRKDLERDVLDRLNEIRDEERRSRGLITDTGQLQFFADKDASRGGFEARRRAVELYRQQRLQEIAAFEEVDEPSSPRPLGALFLVPEGSAA